MANAEQLAILRQGVEAWNVWRVEHPDVVPALQGVDLRDADLRGANLTKAVLHEANLRRADLTRTDLRGATLYGANLTRAILYGTDLREIDLTKATFYAADLQGIDFTKAALYGADFHRANLTRAALYGAILIEAILIEAILIEADLRGANLRRADLRKVDLTRARVGDTTFSNLDLREVQGLETLHHAGPSTIGIDTIYRSEGNIPEQFLQGAGVPETFIEYARALVSAERPINYYSVFISYSSQDEAVAQRLHADLQARGVRCWFAPHDLEIGAPIVRGIDAAIRIYDKLLIIVSEAAVTSRWVDFEVSTALHREVEQGRTMLFPIRLDDAVLHTPSGWAAEIRTRHIGDFRGWKDHDRYQAAFTRLLRDLKAKD